MDRIQIEWKTRTCSLLHWKMCDRRKSRQIQRVKMIIYVNDCRKSYDNNDQRTRYAHLFFQLFNLLAFFCSFNSLLTAISYLPSSTLLPNTIATIFYSNCRIINCNQNKIKRKRFWSKPNTHTHTQTHNTLKKGQRKELKNKQFSKNYTNYTIFGKRKEKRKQQSWKVMLGYKSILIKIYINLKVFARKSLQLILNE